MAKIKAYDNSDILMMQTDEGIAVWLKNKFEYWLGNNGMAVEVPENIVWNYIAGKFDANQLEVLEKPTVEMEEI